MRSQELILGNLRILYDYILENQFHIPKIEFFSGEIWHTQFGLDILDITFDYVNKGMNVDWFLIATNCSFIFYPARLQEIQTRINHFNESGHRLVFSASVDGKVIDSQERPLNNTELVRDDQFYEDLFCFAKHNSFGFHPMVSASSVKYWIENHKWWESQFDRYDMNIDELMMLEVRNADWTDESIADYNKFMDYLIDHYFHITCGSSVEEFSKALMNVRGPNHFITGYIPWSLPETDNFIGCTAATDLTVRLGDLAICPCHRTAYNKYLYGHFVVENEKIVDIEANNPQMAVKVLMANFNKCISGCDTCLFNEYCLKGCFGSQLEVLGDPFIPIPNVCKFFKSKINHLLEKYEQMGVFNYYKTFTKYEVDYERVHKFLELYTRWKKTLGKC